MAFAIAFISAPIIVGIAGAPIFLIPTVGAVLGAPAYLIVGAPLLWRALRHGANETFSFSMYGARINLIGGVILALGYLLVIAPQLSPDAVSTVIVFIVLAIVHGAVWCGLFGALYRRLRNKNFPK